MKQIDLFSYADNLEKLKRSELSIESKALKKSSPNKSKKPKNKVGRPKKDLSKQRAFGGSLLKQNHNPRSARPLKTKVPLHVTLKANQARGSYSMLQKKVSSRIEATIFQFARRFGVKIYRYQNVGNHLHLVIVLSHKSSWTRFIRSVTAKIKQGLEKIWKVKLPGFWSFRPYTRIATWGREFRTLSDYVIKNYLDACGISRTKQNLAFIKSLFQQRLSTGDVLLLSG